MKKLILGLTIGLAATTGFAQDIHFSQFTETPLALNPAMAGAFNGDIRAIANYKDQWRSVASPYKTFDISVDAQLMRRKWKTSYLGVGALVFVDRAGDANMGTNFYNLSLASGIQVGKGSFLAGGLSAALGQRSINYSALTWDNQYDQGSGTFNPNAASGENFSNANFNFFDFSAGIDYNFSKDEMYSTANDKFRLNIGAAYQHLNQPQYSFFGSGEKLYSKIVIHANSLIGIKNSFISWVPDIMYVRQGPNQEILFGSLFRIMVQESSKYTGFYKEAAVSFGAHYRWSDAVVANAFFEIANYAFGISYDINTSDLRAASSLRGGLEFSFRYITPNPFQYKVRPLYNIQ